jgi:hypothetical protein
MDLWLSLLPITSFFSFTRHHFRLPAQRPDWRKSFIYGSVAWGLYLVSCTELLSWRQSITRINLVIIWLLPIFVMFFFSRTLPPNIKLRKLSTLNHRNTSEWILLLLVVLACVITALVAWFSPPQTWDSLNYHMARVAHWAQNASVNHYSTGIEVQNVISPGGEIAILHVYVLGNGDRLSTFVQWWAMVSCTFVISWTAKQLGANRLGQLFSALTVVTIPMGIIQASSTVNDYIVAFWTLITATMAVLIFKEPQRFDHILIAGISSGLALWTKPTSVAFLAPFGITVIVILSVRIKRNPRLFKGVLVSSLLAIFCFLAINAGHWVRNIQTYGNPISDNARLGTHLNELITPAGISSNLIRNLAFHTALPWGRGNLIIYDLILNIHNWLRVDIEDARTTAIGPFPLMAIRTNEESAGNSLHSALAFFSLLVILLRKLPEKRALMLFSLSAVASWLIFSVLFKWQIFGSRYHLPFFVIFSAPIGVVFQSILSSRKILIAGVFLFLGSLPWFFSIDSRPLVPNNGSLTGSILFTSREELLFANAQYQYKAYKDIATHLFDNDCHAIGLSLGGIQTEYLIWHLMGAPRRDLRFEWFVAGTESAKYSNLTFSPCAVICEGCDGPGNEFYNGLPLFDQSAEFKLYLQPNLVP